MASGDSGEPENMDVSLGLNAALSHLANEYSALEEMVKQKMILNHVRTAQPQRNLPLLYSNPDLTRLIGLID